MVERLIDLAESTAIVWAVVNEVVTAVLLKCQAGDHVRMAEQLVVCLVLNPDLKAILEIIAAGPIRFPVDVMLQVEICYCLITVRQICIDSLPVRILPHFRYLFQMRLYRRKGFFADHMLDPAGVLGRGLLVHTQFHQYLAQHHMAGVHRLCNGKPGLRQRDRTVGVHIHIPVLFQNGHGSADAGFGKAQLFSHIDSPNEGAILREDIDGFQIHLARLVNCHRNLQKTGVLLIITQASDKRHFFLSTKSIAILEMASLDILNALGVGDRVVGTASTRLEYLQDYINDEIANLGTIKEADLEAVMACEPDVIFISGRLSSSYDALSEIAPVVFLATDTELGIVESVRRNAATIASMFGLEDQVDELMAGFDARIQALQAVSEGQTAIVGMCTSGSFNVPGNDGRCSIIGVEAGFENIGVDANIDTSTHGNEASFEFLVEKAPDYIFVMDRDAAIGTDSAQLAQDIMEMSW